MIDACASCEQDRPIVTRGLCDACRSRYRRDGTIAEWGWVRDDKAANYVTHRRRGASLTLAASHVGVSERTAWRYEAELRDASSSGWPVTREAAA